MQFEGTNIKYKDRLFRFIFGTEENKEWTLNLYNAINGSNYQDANTIEYTTIDDVIYMGMKNDISFIIENTMSLYEHQSTFCPNMPTRFSIYWGKLLEGYVQSKGLRLYSKKTQPIPRPKCICFYNGLDKQEDKVIVKLSDLFFENTKRDDEISGITELEVVMININYGHNRELLDRCKPLYEYSFLVDRIRLHIDEIKKDTENDYTLICAINKAISDLPENFVILPFIMKNRAEVCNMCLFEYNEKKHIQDERDEARQEGKEEGREEGREEERIRLLVKWVLKNRITIEEAAEEAYMSVEEFKKILEAKKNENKNN